MGLTSVSTAVDLDLNDLLGGVRRPDLTQALCQRRMRDKIVHYIHVETGASVAEIRPFIWAIGYALRNESKARSAKEFFARLRPHWTPLLNSSAGKAVQRAVKDKLSAALDDALADYRAETALLKIAKRHLGTDFDLEAHGLDGASSEMVGLLVQAALTNRMLEAVQRPLGQQGPRLMPPVSSTNRGSIYLRAIEPTFLGRDALLSELSQFAPAVDDIPTAADCISVWCLYGPAGAGKRRLAKEFCLNYVGPGWIAGSLDANELKRFEWRHWDPEWNHLLVVEVRSADDLHAVEDAINELVSRRRALSRRINFLLLADSHPHSMSRSYGSRERNSAIVAEEHEYAPPRAVPRLPDVVLRAIARDAANRRLAAENSTHRFNEDSASLKKAYELASDGKLPLFAVLAGAYVAEKELPDVAASPARHFVMAEAEDRVKPFRGSAADRAALSPLIAACILGGVPRNEWRGSQNAYLDCTTKLGCADPAYIPGYEPLLVAFHVVDAALALASTDQAVEALRHCVEVDSGRTREFFESARNAGVRYPDLGSLILRAEPSTFTHAYSGWLKAALDLSRRDDPDTYYELLGRFWNALDAEVPLDSKLIGRVLARAPDFEAARRIYKEIQDRGVTADEMLVTVMLQRAEPQHFRWATDETRDRHVDHDMLYALWRLDGALSLTSALDSLKKHSLRLTSFGVLNLVRRLPAHEIDRLLETAEHRGIPISQPTLKTALLKLPMERAVNTILERGRRGDHVWQSTILSVLLNATTRGRAALREDGEEKLDGVVDTLLQLLIEAKRIVGADLLTVMLASSRGPVRQKCLDYYLSVYGSLDIVAFTVVCERDPTLRGSALIDAARDLGFEVDSYLLRAAMDHAGSYDECLKLFRAHINEKCPPNVYHFAALFRYGRRDEVNNVFELMGDVAADRWIFEKYVFPVRRQDIPLATKLQWFNEYGSGINWNERLFRALMDGALNHAEAKQILLDAQEYGFGDDPILFARGIAQANSFREALEWYESFHAEDDGERVPLIEALLRAAAGFKPSPNRVQSLLEDFERTSAILSSRTSSAIRQRYGNQFDIMLEKLSKGRL